MRRPLIWGVLLIVYVSFSVVIVFWYASPSKTDVAFERQLIGKWGIWIVDSELNTVPERVIEWLPNGKSDSYSIGFERPIPNPELEEDWYIRNGTLISRFRTPETRKWLETRYKLEWSDSDNLRLTFDRPDGNTSTIFYKRMDAETDLPTKMDEQCDPSKSATRSLETERSNPVDGMTGRFLRELQ